VLRRARIGALLIIALGGCWTAPQPAPAPARPAPRAAPAIVSPGVVYIEGGSNTFERAIELYRTGDWQAATVQLARVNGAESGDNSAVRMVATYDLATIWLEQGQYTIAFAEYDELARYQLSSPEVLALIATGLGRIAERLGDAAPPDLAQTIGELPGDAIERAAPDLRAILRELRAAPEPGRRAERYAADLARIDHETRQLERLTAGWRTALVVGTVTERLQLAHAEALRRCRAERCRPARYVPRAYPHGVGVRAITVTMSLR
jgi:hypothetical protein